MLYFSKKDFLFRLLSATNLIRCFEHGYGVEERVHGLGVHACFALFFNCSSVSALVLKRTTPMVTMLTAFTDEVDEAEFAVQAILEQLDLPTRQLRYAAGLLFCSADFIETGVAKAVCEALPFDVIGCTSLANAAPGGAGMTVLSLSVLTSDTVRFSAVMSEPLTFGLDATIRSAFAKARSGEPEQPALVLAFPPLQMEIGSEAIAEALFTVAGDIPVFGQIGCDHTPELNKTATLFNGRAETTSLPLLFLYGDVTPRFFLKIISDDKIQKQKAIITASEDSVLREVNGMPLMRYMEMLGVSKNNGIENIGVVPFIVKPPDGASPVARAIYTITDEGYAVCAGKMPEGATLTVGRLDRDDVLKTAGDTTTQAVQAGRPDCVLIFSCMSRNMALGADYLAEAEVVRAAMGGTCPYLLSYAGGEICPDVNDRGERSNRFHNFTFIACTL